MNTSSFLWVISILTTAFVGLTLWIAPRLTRKTIFFGVTVSPEFSVSSEADSITRRYQRALLWQGILALGAALCHVPLLLIMPAQITGFAIVFMRTHRAARLHAVLVDPVHVAVVAPRPGTPLWLRLAKVGLFVIIAMSAGYLRFRWSDIPERFPTHWGSDGQPNGWSDRSVLDVFAPLCMAAVNGLVAILVSGIPRRARRIDTDGVAARESARRLAWVEASLVATAYIVTLPLVVLGLWLPLRHNNDLGSLLVIAVVPVFLMILVAGILIFALAHKKDSAVPRVIGDRTQDANWKWGIFYYAPDDPALWVEKRFGFGWTINMGHPTGRIFAWVIAILTLLSLVMAAGALMQPSFESKTSVVWNHVFENDPAILGKWRSVDFVDGFEQFTTGKRTFTGNLYVEELEFRPDGTTSPLTFRWSKGRVWADEDGEVSYSLHNLNGEDYLFMEWFKGKTKDGKRSGYVLRRAP
jgi:uncharacterized membrane protein